MPPFPDSAPRRSRQLDLFRDLPGSDMLLLLDVLAHEATKAAMRGHVRQVIHELSALRDELDAVALPARSSRIPAAKLPSARSRRRPISNG